MTDLFNMRRLMRRNLIFYRLQNLQIMLGIAVTTAVVTGAFIIGNSVSKSLKNAMHNRLGQVNYGIFQSEYWFKADLRERLTRSDVNFNGAALISVPAYMTTNDGQAVKVNLYGIDKNFFALSPCGKLITPPAPGYAMINQTAAVKTGLQTGNSFALRCFKPSVMPGYTAWSRNDSIASGFRLKVSAMLTPVDFGNFNPLNVQLAPANIFVNRDWLAKHLGKTGCANVLLSNGRLGSKLLNQNLALADYGLSMKKLPGKGLELKSDRVFIAPAIVKAANSLSYANQAIFSYFVNRISAGHRFTPYSFLAGTECAPNGEKLSGHEAAINSWLAADLKLKSGDYFTINYYKFGLHGELDEAVAKLRVKEIYQLEASPDLMPDFPGMANAESCSDWDPGIPIDLKLVRKKDEAYWNKYRGTPKIFIALDTARQLFGSRFGDTTALRFSGIEEKKLRHDLPAAVKPAALGFNWQPLNAIGRYGVNHAVDFSGLFFGLSFFIIAAGVILSGLVYQLHLEKRSSEFAALKTMGYGNHHLWRILMREAAATLPLGIAMGIAVAWGYSSLIIWALNNVWNNIAGSIQVTLSFSPQAVFSGIAASLLPTAAAMFIVVRKIISSELRISLVKSDFHHKNRHIYLMTGMAALLTGITVICLGINSGSDNVGVFFSAASLLFIGMNCLSCTVIQILPEYFKSNSVSLISTALRNNSRHLRRSMAVVTIMALGIFLTLAVSFNRTENRGNNKEKKSGTGGFGWYIETAIPVKGDLNSASGRRRYNIALPPTSNIVQLSMKDGGAAGCLNLNRVSRPRLLGVAPGIFKHRFSFQTPEVTWADIQQDDAEIIPAIADQNVILWSLGLKVGDILDYPGADGKSYKLKFIAGLNNSILQGAVLISLKNLQRMFPGANCRVLLLEQHSEAIAKAIGKKLAKLGPDVENTNARLNRFGAIQNNYLMVFLALGGIGLLIGTLGLSIILRRNLLERKTETAWMRSAGFSRRYIAFMLTVEHMILFNCALLTGVTAAAAAGIPVILSPSGAPPWGEMILLIALLWTFAVIFIVSAAYSANKGDIINQLRYGSE